MKTYRFGLITLFFFLIMAASLQLYPVHNAQAAAVYAPATDPMRGKQSYLDLIGMDGAWAATPTGGKPLVIAVVDTGIDLTHPDLEANLVPGVNLIDPKMPAQDDYGHGTNVAGIIAASINNDKGIAGIARNVKLMPIKALASDGYGGEQKLGEGIRYAVDHGANMVVLSLGLNKQSAYMEDIVHYAEEKNVLLVAAVGNDGGAVKFPAAYPTVLAVGGIGLDGKLEPRSNYGPELDLVAPWTVYTTALGGRYEYKEGSSMAAPQAAGTAALIWSKYPNLKAYQVRDLLRQSAEDIHSPGWDNKTGFGLLRADQALTQTLKNDAFEPNDVIEQAQPLSVETVASGEFASRGDQDWFRLDSEYDGTVSLRLTWDGTNGVVLQTTEDDGTTAEQGLQSGEPVRLPVKKGSNFIMLKSPDLAKGALRYRIETSFQIYVDPFEDNNRQYKAFMLPTRTQTVTGTFHDDKDQDWYKLVIRKSGKIRVNVSVDTLRMDPVLTYQREGEKLAIVDRKGDGIGEGTPLLDVVPGEFWVKVSNFKENMSLVNGEYTLTIEYTEQAVDPFEPNDRPFQASATVRGMPYKGVIEDEQDADWFYFNMLKDSEVQVDVQDMMPFGLITAVVYDASMHEVGRLEQAQGVPRMEMKRRLPVGYYTIKFTAKQWKDRLPYSLTLR